MDSKLFYNRGDLRFGCGIASAVIWWDWCPATGVQSAGGCDKRRERGAVENRCVSDAWQSGDNDEEAMSRH